MPNLFDMYVKNLKAILPLTKEREKELFEAEITDDGFLELIHGNLRFVVKIAKEYSEAWPNFDIMDLIQEGNIGLMAGIVKFEPKKGFRLTTFVSPRIRGAIYRYIQQHQNSVNVTKTDAHAKLFDKYSKEKTVLESQNLPTDTKAMADHLNVKEKDLGEVEPLLAGNGVVSLTDSNLNLLDEDDPETMMLKKEKETRIAQLIRDFSDTLTEPQRFVFRNRMISDEPLTQEELAKITMTTQQNVSKIEQNVIRSAREFFSKDDIKDVLNNG